MQSSADKKSVDSPPDLNTIKATAEQIAPYIVKTPEFRWSGRKIEQRLGADTRLHLKLELLQRSGSFKARGAINNVRMLSDAEKQQGITGVSSGNHAIAVAYAASCFNTHAKVVMLANSNPRRIEEAKSYGAEVVIAENGIAGFRMVDEIVANERRIFIHPFEGPAVTAATATCAVEFIESAGEFDAMLVAVGGGGLASGVSLATKLLNPKCQVYGIEPEGAAVMTESLKAGEPITLPAVNTIADSLAPPMTTPFAYAMCSRYIDEVVLVSDDEIAAATAVLFQEMKLAVEPSGAATVAAAFGPLREKLKGKRVGLIICGANIDIDGFADLVNRGLHYPL